MDKAKADGTQISLAVFKPTKIKDFVGKRLSGNGVRNKKQPYNS